MLGEVEEPRTRTKHDEPSKAFSRCRHPRASTSKAKDSADSTTGGNYATAVVTLRTANDSITRVTPLMIMLTPTRTPIAQAELIGHCM